MRVARMGDQADSAGPEMPVGLVRARDLRGERLGKCPVHKGKVNADLLEHLAAHQPHPPAAKVFGAVATGPFGQLEPPGRAGIEGPVDGIFQCLEAGADIVLQRFEPGAGARLAGIEIGIGHAAFDALSGLLRQARCCHRPQVRITRVDKCFTGASRVALPQWARKGAVCNTGPRICLEGRVQRD